MNIISRLCPFTSRFQSPNQHLISFLFFLEILQTLNCLMIRNS